MDRIYEYDFIRVCRQLQIAKSVVTALTESDIEPMAAINLFYSSNTFTQLTDVNIGLYLKPWQEIYEMMKVELMMKQNN